MYTLRDAARAAKQSASGRSAERPVAPARSETAPPPAASTPAPPPSPSPRAPAAGRGWVMADRRSRYVPRRPYAADPAPGVKTQSAASAPQAAAPPVAGVSEAAGAKSVKPRFARMPQVDVDDAVNWLLSGKRWILLGSVAGLLAGAAFGMLAQPRYTVYTDILVPPSNLQVVNNDLYASSLQSDAQVLEVESRMRVLTSGNVLRRVAERLDLEDDEEFVGRPKWWDVRALISPKPASGDPLLPVVRALSERIKVGRQERSYLVTASVWSWAPEKSVRIANALTEAFREELVRGDASGAAQAAQTLTDRLGELKSAVTQAEDKVQSFRREHNLQQSGAGQLVSAQSMEQINAKLIDAQAREAEAAARYRELSQARAGALDPSSSLQSPTLTQLRVQYAELKRQVESMSLTYGPRHPALTTMRTQLRAIEREVLNETARMMTAAKVDLDQARAALKSLAADTAKARSSVSQDDEAQVRLRELERDAAAKSSIYQSFLVRAGEATQRERVDATSVRVVSSAAPPEQRSYPPRTLYLALGGLIAGFLFGCALALAIGFAGAYRRMLRET